jgi:lipopolysaccharide/colanic/teichoic acid biosynthesis glycosyltransferase
VRNLKESIDRPELEKEIQLSLNINKYLILKRVIDLLIVIFLLPIAIPALIIGMLSVKLFSRGPIFFIQERVGLNNKPFKIYKLRTMVYQPVDIDLSHTVKNDERIFKAGKILRVTKIDEIPQFLNIFKGDMSLIGPRPERLEIVDKLSMEIPSYSIRHLVKPGLSGLAQINNPTATPNESVEKLEYDLYYINNLNLILDLKIFWKTFFIVLRLDSL